MSSGMRESIQTKEQHVQRPCGWTAVGNREELQGLCDWRAETGEARGRLCEASNATSGIWGFVPRIAESH